MAVYWLMALVPVVLALFPLRGTHALRETAWWTVGVLFVMVIGLRREVGADWDMYLLLHADAAGGSFWNAVSGPDPGYALLDKLSSTLGLGIYGTNLVCSLLFISGLVAFVRRLPLPWVALAVATPYLGIVVAMGYTRQSAAIGILFFGFNCLMSGRRYWYLILVVAATLFHKAALPFGLLALLTTERRGAVWFAVLAGFVLSFAAVLLLEEYTALWERYIVETQESEGGLVRVLMNVVAGFAMFAFWRRWRERFGGDEPWKYFALLSLACLGLLSLASTAVDRLALFLAPLQLVVWSRLPVLIEDTALRASAVLFILAVYCSVLYVWLNHAVYADAWLPYRNALF